MYCGLFWRAFGGCFKGILKYDWEVFGRYLEALSEHCHWVSINMIINILLNVYTVIFLIGLCGSKETCVKPLMSRQQAVTVLSKHNAASLLQVQTSQVQVVAAKVPGPL